MTLHELLVRLRERACLGVSAAAQKAGISRTTLWRWENDRRTPGHDELRALLSAYDVTVDEWETAERLRRAMVKA